MNITEDLLCFDMEDSTDVVPQVEFNSKSEMIAFIQNNAKVNGFAVAVKTPQLIEMLLYSVTGEENIEGGILLLFQEILEMFLQKKLVVRFLFMEV